MRFRAEAHGLRGVLVVQHALQCSPGGRRVTLLQGELGVLQVIQGLLAHHERDLDAVDVVVAHCLLFGREPVEVEAEQQFLRPEVVGLVEESDRVLQILGFVLSLDRHGADQNQHKHHAGHGTLRHSR